MRRVAVLVATVVALALIPRMTQAQVAFLDRLQLVSLGGGAGSIAPSQVKPTTIFVLGSDYGEISPAWRVVFRTSYWESRFEDDVINTFADTIQKHLSDTSVTVTRSPVTLYDVTFAIGARRILMPRSDLTPFFTAGVAAHVINAEGDLIKGTFVERSLDAIAGGLFGEVGLRGRLMKRLLVEGSVRGDMLSGFRSVQWYGMASYFFSEPRKATGR